MPATVFVVVVTQRGDGVPNVGGLVGDNAPKPLLKFLPPHFNAVAGFHVVCNGCRCRVGVGGGCVGGGCVGGGCVGGGCVGGGCVGVGAVGCSVGTVSRGGGGVGFLQGGHEHDVVLQVEAGPQLLALPLGETNARTHAKVPVEHDTAGVRTYLRVDLVKARLDKNILELNL